MIRRKIILAIILGTSVTLTACGSSATTETQVSTTQESTTEAIDAEDTAAEANTDADSAEETSAMKILSMCIRCSQTAELRKY